MNLTTSKRESQGGYTILTIADGLVYIDIYRDNIHIEQRTYDATDLLNMNINHALLAGGSGRRKQKKCK